MTFHTSLSVAKTGGLVCFHCGPTISLATLCCCLFFDTVRNFPSHLMAKNRSNITSGDGCLGSNNDDGCSEV